MAISNGRFFPGTRAGIGGQIPSYPQSFPQNDQHLIPRKDLCCSAFSLRGGAERVNLLLPQRTFGKGAERKGSGAGADRERGFGTGSDSGRFTGVRRKTELFGGTLENWQTGSSVSDGIYGNQPMAKGRKVWSNWDGNALGFNRNRKASGVSATAQCEDRV